MHCSSTSAMSYYTSSSSLALLDPSASNYYGASSSSRSYADYGAGHGTSSAIDRYYSYLDEISSPATSSYTSSYSLAKKSSGLGSSAASSSYLDYTPISSRYYYNKIKTRWKAESLSFRATITEDYFGSFRKKRMLCLFKCTIFNFSPFKFLGALSLHPYKFICWIDIITSYFSKTS